MSLEIEICYDPFLEHVRPILKQQAKEAATSILTKYHTEFTVDRLTERMVLTIEELIKGEKKPEEIAEYVPPGNITNQYILWEGNIRSLSLASSSLKTGEIYFSEQLGAGSALEIRTQSLNNQYKRITDTKNRYIHWKKHLSGQREEDAPSAEKLEERVRSKMTKNLFLTITENARVIQSKSEELGEDTVKKEVEDALASYLKEEYTTGYLAKECLAVAKAYMHEGNVDKFEEYLNQASGLFMRTEGMKREAMDLKRLADEAQLTYRFAVAQKNMDWHAVDWGKREGISVYNPEKDGMQVVFDAALVYPAMEYGEKKVCFGPKITSSLIAAMETERE